MSCDQPQADQERQEAIADSRTRARIARDTLAERQAVQPLDCRCEIETHVPYRIGDNIFLKCIKCKTLTNWSIRAAMKQPIPWHRRAEVAKWLDVACRLLLAALLVWAALLLGSAQ